MTDEQRAIRGNQARDLLDNPLLKDAFEAVDRYLDNQALACNPDDRDQAQRVILSKQIFQALRREIVRIVEDGQIATVRLREVERKRGLFKR